MKTNDNYIRAESTMIENRKNILTNRRFEMKSKAKEIKNYVVNNFVIDNDLNDQEAVATEHRMNLGTYEWKYPERNEETKISEIKKDRANPSNPAKPTNLVNPANPTKLVNPTNPAYVKNPANSGFDQMKFWRNKFESERNKTLMSTIRKKQRPQMTDQYNMEENKSHISKFERKRNHFMKTKPNEQEEWKEEIFSPEKSTKRMGMQVSCCKV